MVEGSIKKGILPDPVGAVILIAVPPVASDELAASLKVLLSTLIT